MALTALSLTSCDDFLDAKPNKALVTLDSLNDLQAVLDNTLNTMNAHTFIPLLSSDEFYTNNAGISGLPFWQQNVFLYVHPPFGEDAVILDWQRPYAQIFYANVVLDEIDKIKTENIQELSRKKEIKGSAHFHRAYAYFNLLQVFADSFDPSASNEMPAVPKRINADPNIKPEMGTVSEMYRFVIEDLETAIENLPEKNQPLTRPSKLAAYGMLARVYLNMEDYAKALEFSRKALEIDDSLIDYSELNLGLSNPFGVFNKEIIFYSEYLFSGFFTGQLSMVNGEFYDSYEAKDLRKSAFFTPRLGGWVNYTGYYSGSSRYFGGLTTAEMLLINAECRARSGDYKSTEGLLGRLLEKRYETGEAPSLEFNSEEEALTFILQERIKELFGRGIRWSDLRRLNRDSRFAKTIEKNIEGQIYTLPPNDPRYTLPIPPREVNLDLL